MNKQWKRREILKQMAAASGAMLLPAGARGAAEIAAGGVAGSATIAGRECEIQIASVSASTVRLSILPIEGGRVCGVIGNGSLVRESWGEPVAKWRGDVGSKSVKSGKLVVSVAAGDGGALSFVIADAQGKTAQRLTVDAATGAVSFLTGDAPLLGLGEGGPQFDRRGSVDRMVSGQGGYKLESHGGRVPIPWLIGTAGWAIYFSRTAPRLSS